MDIRDNLIAEVDHIVPRSRGGTDAFRNLVCACRECNKEKGNRTAEEFGYPDIVGAMFNYPTYLQQGKSYIMKY